MMKRTAVAFLMSVACSAGALAQGASISDADKSFLTKDASGASYELRLAKLAVSRTSRDEVRTFAERLVKDHEAYNPALADMGKAFGLALPTDPDASDAARLETLQRLSGPAFDAQFIKEMQRVNAEDKRDADEEKASTGSKAIKDFVAKFAATDAEHETMANQLAKART